MNNFTKDLLLKEQIYNTRNWIAHYKREALSCFIYFGMCVICMFITLLEKVKSINSTNNILDVIFYGFLFLVISIFTINLYKTNTSHRKHYEGLLKKQEEAYNLFLKGIEEGKNEK